MQERVLNLVDAVQLQVWRNYLIALDEEGIKYIIQRITDACVYAVTSIIINLKTSVPDGDICKIGIDIVKEAIWAIYQIAKEQ